MRRFAASTVARWASTPARPALVYDYGFNVETAGDHPVWHASEVDVLPGDKT